MTQLAADDFNRADGALGANWSAQTGETGAPTISSNAVVSTDGGRGANYSGASWPNDQWAECVLAMAGTASDEGGGPMVRASASAMTYYLAQGNTSETRLYKCVSGSYTQLGSDGASCANGDTLRLDVVGTSLTVKKNGSSIITATDGSIASGRAGMRITAAGGGILDSWAGGDFAAAAVLLGALIGSRRNRPGRGPYSQGRFYRPRAEHNRTSEQHSVTITETASGAEALSAQLAFTPSLAESASAADAISSALTLALSVADAASSADQVSAGAATYPVTITEAGSAADALSSSVGGFDVTIAETAAAVDSISALLAAAVTLTETGSAADSYSNIATLLAALAESLTATDQYSSSVNGNNYSVDFAEAASAVEAIAAQVAWSRDVAETGNASDTNAAQVAFAQALAEALIALEAVSATGITNVTITETGAASDNVSAPTGFEYVTRRRVITIQRQERRMRVTRSRN